jgi:hypothetical protein
MMTPTAHVADTQGCARKSHIQLNKLENSLANLHIYINLTRKVMGGVFNSISLLYIQHAIPQSTKSIRLLRLNEVVYAEREPDDNLPISLACSFEIHDLTAAPEFVALSYTWGTDDIVCDNTLVVDGEVWPLRTNLRDALLHV